MRILIVDDNKEIRDFLSSAFQTECYVADCSDNGKDGSFLARTNDYDIIVLDLNLPGKDGLSVCREVREDGIKTPIIILTVRDEVPTKVELFSSGADDYLTKPFSFEELLARVKALLRRPNVLNGENITVGKLDINLAKNEVTYAGKKIILTRKEYMLLEYLAKNKDKVLSRGVIMEHVWDMNADPFSNTIEVHVRNLRRKLGLSHDEDFIQTVSGRGYMLNSSGK